jgi:calcineurin-like phosphoesterase family protein
MDRQMIDWWNSVLRPEDEVWHLDDFAFRQRTRWTSVRKVKDVHQPQNLSYVYEVGLL